MMVYVCTSTYIFIFNQMLLFSCRFKFFCLPKDVLDPLPWTHILPYGSSKFLSLPYMENEIVPFSRRSTKHEKPLYDSMTCHV
jgi:hypothetical protein